ncbi:hypothetical protein DB30_02882 [Enhygromyxa salina]|uniref:Uncharacterized protein n=1 Tax=Enhygromyxa salina TaxID=215803 RepID=A0A0C1ZLL8_9BACT|nr:hypothetical protein [Enhygromyxa salina]KIG11663.1 hypothetical protein DB30_02882 [Enhygromyxa salina]
MCHVTPTKSGTLLQCTDEGGPGDPLTWAAVKVCGPGWCHDLLAYDDCNDYNSTEIQFEDVTCYDLI